MNHELTLYGLPWVGGGVLILLGCTAGILFGWEKVRIAFFILSLVSLLLWFSALFRTLQ